MKPIKELVCELQAYPHEEEWFEFKENWFEPKELGEYISALANSAAYDGREYSYFIWGIHDTTHEIVGTKFNQNQDIKKEPLKHFLARQLSPENNFEFNEGIIDGKRVVVLQIPAAKVVPVAFNNERFIRIGSSKEKLRKYPEKESKLFAALNTWNPTIQNTPAEYQDLTFEKLQIYYGAKGVELNPQAFKTNMGFYTEDGKYNLLAQLLSDNSHMTINVAIFSGKTKADNMYSVRSFGSTCLLYSLDEVLRYGDVLNILQADEKDRVVERKEVPLFENEAFREAVINAFVHNAWVNKAEPMITVFSDRIEILSYGTLPRGQTMEGFFRGDSVPVNRQLSEIFLQLHISEKTGRGVPRIVEKYGTEAFTFHENSIVVTIPFNWINIMSAKSVGSDSDNSNTLTETQASILVELRNNPNITRTQLADLLGKGTATISRGLSALQDAGLVERIGSNKTGYWKVND